MNLKLKMIFSFLLIGLLPVIIITFGVIFITSMGFKEEAVDRLKAVTILKKQSLEAYFNRKLKDLELFSNNKFLQTCLKQYNVDLINNKIDNKRLLYYFDVFDQYILNNINFEKLNYHDLFIVDTSGNIIYTFAKEDDLRTNLLYGKYKNTNLAKVFKKGLKENTFADIEVYTPSNKLALFAAAPIYDYESKETLGVLIIQSNNDNINKVMEETTGLGKSGETYIIGSDYLLKSNLKLNKNLTIEKAFRENIRIKTEAINTAFIEDFGTKINKDYRGIEVLSCYAKLDIKGLNWVIISEIDKAEVLSKVKYLNVFISIFIILLFFTLLFTSFNLATSITTPIKYISNVLKTVSEGNYLVDIKESNSKSEIGELNNAAINLLKKLNLYKNQIEKKHEEDIISKNELIQYKEKNLTLLKTSIKDYRNQLKIVSNQVLDGFVIFDTNKNKIINVNMAFCNMLNFTRNELLTMNIKDLFPVENQTIIINQFLQESHNKTVLEKDILCNKKDGTTILLDIEHRRINYNNKQCVIAFFKNTIKDKNTA
ncbi:MAG: cache domain-containing protein, partial [Cyanobacteriota bacterium]